MCSDFDTYLLLRTSVIPVYFNHFHFQKKNAQFTSDAELNLHKEWILSK